jgi:hypothetical protein
LPDAQCVPGGQYIAEQLPLQSLAAHEGGKNDCEQHFDQQPVLVWQPRQNQWPATVWHDSPLLALHFTPHALQSESVVVCTGMPPQQRAVSSPAIQLKPSARACAVPQTPAAHAGGS